MALRSEVWVKRLLADKYRASLGTRFLGFCYDLFCIFMLWLLIGVLSTAWLIISSDAPLHYDFGEIRGYILEFEPHLFYINLAIQFTAIFSYIFLFPLVATERRSLGMMLVGLKFLDEHANEITRGKFLKREILKWLLFPGILLALSSEKQSLADKLCKTYVTYY